MRHATFARWSTDDSFIHRLDARIKLVLLLAFLVSLALLRSPSLLQLAACFALLVALIFAARLPLVPILRVSLLVVPFVGLFSLIVYLTGDSQRAFLILAKSYLSALSALITVSATPFPQLLAAARFFRVPALLLEVTQLIYRYLFVLGGEARVMQTAFTVRGGLPGRRAIQGASGMIAVLFSRSHEKATMIHQAMCGRGFSGTLARYDFAPLRAQDWAIIACGFALVVAVHVV